MHAWAHTVRTRVQWNNVDGIRGGKWGGFIFEKTNHTFLHNMVQKGPTKSSSLVFFLSQKSYTQFYICSSSHFISIEDSSMGMYALNVAAFGDRGHIGAWKRKCEYGKEGNRYKWRRGRPREGIKKGKDTGERTRGQREDIEVQRAWGGAGMSERWRQKGHRSIRRV